jgi:hypothetical protein
VELLLRWSVAPHRATGYEVLFSLLAGNPYVDIVRWNGALGDFTYLAQGYLPQPLTEGDVVKATINGQIITAFVNDVPVLQAWDDSFHSGSPGLGFFFVPGGSATSTDFGFTSYSATSNAVADGSSTQDGTGRTWSHVQTVAVDSGARSTSVSSAAMTTGNLVVVQVAWSDRSNFVSISDRQGNTFIPIGVEQQSILIGVKSRLFYAANIRGGANTITTVVTGSPRYHEVYVHEYSGLDPIAPLDGYSVLVAGGQDFTSGLITTSGEHELLYGIEIDSSSASAASPWTTRSTLNGNVAADADAATPGPYAFTGRSSGAYIAWIAAFRTAP